MSKFIYVFSVDDRDKLLSMGYTLIKSDERNSYYVFENRESLQFDVKDLRYIASSTLTF